MIISTVTKYIKDIMSKRSRQGNFNIILIFEQFLYPETTEIFKRYYMGAVSIEPVGS